VQKPNPKIVAKLGEYIWQDLREILTREAAMTDQKNAWKKYRRPGITEMRRWVPEDGANTFSLSTADARSGSPKPGDMLARNPKNHADRWLVNAAYFVANFAPVEDQ
jgi:hypothetical protein